VQNRLKRGTKIVLIYPYFLEARIHVEEISVPPLGVYFVAAVLKDNQYDVEILNWYNVHRHPQRIETVLREKNPDVIGFSILHANRWGGIDIAKTAKRLNSDVITVFGGIGASYLWSHLLTHFTDIDFVVIGEGEYPFLQLIQHLEGSGLPLEQIDGIAYRKNNRPVRTTRAAPVEPLDQLPHPSQYFSFQHLAVTRGCPGHCSFCGSPGFWGRGVRYHSADYFVDELERLNRKGLHFFFISDDTFTANKQLVIDICRKIIDRRIHVTWQAISRVDLISEQLLYWMRKAGCIQISYGVESGSEHIRRTVLKKSFSNSAIENAFRLTHHYGILSRAYFIYGVPGETRHTIQASIDLMGRIHPLSAIFYILDLFPGTALYEAYKRKFDLTDDIWLDRIEDILYFETDQHLTQDRILAFGRQLRTAFYQQLSDAVKRLDLIDREEFYPLHADFLSRLAMTFDQGDYARIDAIPDKAGIARRLYHKALTYFPDARAFLGLGILYQKAGRYAASERLLHKGRQHFPDNEHISLCLGISYMNLGEYHKALDCLTPFQSNDQVRSLIDECRQRLG
jgi:radical SAM superfamily enzyme YgiQ (UPF0313 family)